MLDRIGIWLTHYPRLIVVAVLLAVLGFASGGLRLQFVTDYRAYFDPANPDLKHIADLESRFGATDDILLALEPKDGQVLTTSGIERVAALADALREMPYANRVDSIADIPVAADTGAGPALTTLRGLASDPALDPAILQQAAVEVARLTRGTLLGEKNDIAAAHVTVNLPNMATYAQTGEVQRYVLEQQKKVEAEFAPDRVLLAGVVPYYHAIMDLAMRDIALLIPVCLLVAIGILRGLLASWRATWACCIPVVAAVLVAVGAHGWIGNPVTVATVVVPIMVLVISLAYNVHLADTFLDLRSEFPTAAQAARASLRANIVPLSLTTGTTLLGFFSMNNSVSPPYRDMGNTTLVGVMAAAVFAVVLMPPLLCWLDPPYWREKGLLRRGLDRLADAIVQPIRSRLALWLGGGLIVGLLACIPLNTVDDNISEWFSDSSRLRQDNQTVNLQLTGMQQLYYELPAGGPGGVHDPQYLARVAQFAQWLRTQPNVVAVRALPDLVQALSRNFGGADAIPQDPAKVEQLLYTYEFSAAPGDRAGGLLDDARSSSLVHVSLRNRPGYEFQAFDRNAQAWLAQHLPELGVKPGTSAVMMFSKMAHENIPPMIWGTIGVLVITALVVTVALGSFRLGLISLVPALVPIGMAFGLWGLISGHVGIALSVVSNAALGIIVDDTIHMLGRYRAARRSGMATAAEACQYTIRHVGGALTTTTLVLAVGVGMIGFSNVQPTHEMGIFLAMTFVFSWLCVLVLLPQLLTRFDK